MDFPMPPIRSYIYDHVVRGECQCGKCPVLSADLKEAHRAKFSAGSHSIDMNVGFLSFFNTEKAVEPATKEQLIKLIKEHESCYDALDILNGEEHSYLNVGAWIGDQGLALLCMALGVHLGIFELRSPASMMPFLPKEEQQQLAGMGMICVKAIGVEAPAAA